MDTGEALKKLRAESDRLFALHVNAEPSIELYHREAENLTWVRELYWTLVWSEYEG